MTLAKPTAARRYLRFLNNNPLSLDREGYPWAGTGTRKGWLKSHYVRHRASLASLHQHYFSALLGDYQYLRIAPLCQSHCRAMPRSIFGWSILSFR